MSGFGLKIGSQDYHESGNEMIFFFYVGWDPPTVDPRAIGTCLNKSPTEAPRALWYTYCSWQTIGTISAVWNAEHLHCISAVRRLMKIVQAAVIVD